MRGILRNHMDRSFAVILEPDEWERDEETLFTNPDIIHKVNPHVGITVQPDYYEREIANSLLDPGKKKETITKLFNVFQTKAVVDWFQPDDITKLQVPVRIDDLSSEDGWHVFCGMDFSLGNDLHASSYLCANAGTGEKFADMDAWITEKALAESPIRPLLQQWVDQCWLHVSPGAVLQPELPVARIIELSDRLVFVRCLYDPYKSKTPINTLKAWLYSQGVDPDSVVVPCRQNFATFNPAVMELDYAVKADPPLIKFSPNPMWPWQAGNMVLMTSNDGMENHKPAKRGRDTKIDNFICLLEALIGFDQVDGSAE